MYTTPPYNPDQTYMVELDYQGLLAVEGPDASKFLQGQLTCDLRQLSPRHSQLGAHCNLKGRMIGNFRILQDRDQRVLLRMHGGILADVQAALGKYIVFSKAKLVDISTHYVRLGLVGPQAEQLLAEHIDVPPVQDGDWSSCDRHLVLKLAPGRYECWLATDVAEDVVKKLAGPCLQGDDNLWTLMDIRAGLGEVRPETREVFTPQALNYQLIDGVSFRKGCYTGQEVVARLHYKGKLKRHMYRVSFPWAAQPPPSPGSNMPATDGQTSPGQIVMAAHSEAGRVEALAVLNDRVLADEANTQSQKLRLLPLPYAIPKGNPNNSVEPQEKE